MQQLLFRTLDLKEFEVLICKTGNQGIDKINRKTIGVKRLIESLESLRLDGATKEELIYSTNIYEYQDARSIAYKKFNNKEEWIYDLKEQYIRTFYNDKCYKVLHPNAFIKIVVKNRCIDEMYIYPYIEDKGLETVLYDNPFPNGYSSNKTCMGTAAREIEGDNLKAIIGILETPYTHAHTAFKGKELKDTEKAFEYLQKNLFPYGLMKATNKKLRDII